MRDLLSLAEELKTFVASLKVNEPLARHTSLGVGGPADFFVEVKTVDEVRRLWAWAKEKKLPVFPLGQGSNLLVSDKGLRGVVAHLAGEFDEVVFDGEQARAGAGVPLPRLARLCAERGLEGAEPLAGIPGTVGGGLMTNAGTPEGDIGALVESVEVLEPAGELRSLPKKDLGFSYRCSNLPGRFVLSARLKLRRGDINDIMTRIQNQLKRRAEKQPVGTLNCGSVFKNPPGDFAARLYEAAGLNGARAGGAQVSLRHANFIENVAHATA
ncbi:MAG: UDP-N-acetylmuramate dehydrogenase, partial [Elusimicrobia bacterium]|nr:UDP-N-acetylmuramate dehydrogenase [Elusimicrobiota bacterium]